MNQSLLYGLATLGIGLLALVVRYSFKSKCVKVNLCYGLVTLERDVESEMKSDIPTLHRNKSSLDVENV